MGRRLVRKIVETEYLVDDEDPEEDASLVEDDEDRDEENNEPRADNED